MVRADVLELLSRVLYLNHQSDLSGRFRWFRRASSDAVRNRIKDQPEVPPLSKHPNHRGLGGSSRGKIQRKIDSSNPFSAHRAPLD